MDKKIAEMAKEAASQAYVPYSHFPVGAAIVSQESKVFLGCNIENASFGLSNCAERTALFKAVSEGIHDFSAIYIYGETESPISPCGACRQVLSEFCDDEMPVYLLSKNLEVKATTILELLPYHFTKKDVETND
ncbi:MAG: cytidine deaminase [Streptococcaceae bacterium]|jgi:cytidine deaminase|nr:cytidine deaminase [Streptococcaceae bacterium]